MTVVVYADGRPLPLVPHGWSWTTLSELLSGIEAGKSFKCDERPPKDTEQGLVKVSAVTWGTYDEQESKTITEPGRVQERYRIKVGDLLFSRANTIELVGASVIVHDVRKNLLLSDKILRLQAPDELKHWINWFLRSRTGRSQIEALSTGNQNSMRNIGQERIGQIRVPVAPSNEVTRIVSKIDELFSRIDEGERALERVQKLVERYRQSVLKAAVTGELTREWREKNKDNLESGEALLARILKARREAWEKAELEKMKAKGITPANEKWKQRYEEPASPDTTNLPVLPNGWVWVRFEQLGFVESGTTPPNIDDHLSESGTIPWFKVSSMNEPGNEVSLSTSKWRVTPEGARACRLKVLPPGTIVFPKRGGAILTNKKRVLGVPGTLDLNTMGFVPADDLGGYMKMLFDRLDLKTIYDGSNVPQINYDDVADLTVALPGSHECAEIASAVPSHLMAGAALARDIEHLASQSRATKQVILRSAFAGTLVAHDPTDEPASTLLARIAAERGTDNAAPKRGCKKKTAA